MKFYDDDDYDDNDERGSGSNMTLIYMALIMSTVIFAVTALVFWANGSKKSSDGSGYRQAVAQREERMLEESKSSGTAASDNVISSSKLTSDQLDIWTLPDTGRQSSSNSNSGNGTVTNQTTGETVGGSSEKSSEKETTTTADELVSGKTSVYDMAEREDMSESDKANEKNTDKSNDKSTDKDEEDEDEEEMTSIRVTHSDGTKEWVDIDDDLDRNNYNYDNLKYDNPIMRYIENGKTASWFGVDISAEQGDVDFAKLKKAKCDFCMIKVGARGYSSGNIVMDENLEDNLEGAQKAKLNTGVYFCSQAVTRAEAREEAEVLLEAIEDYDVNYPIVFVMENVEDDMARIESLDVKDRTRIAIAFMDEISDAGYTPMLYGDLEWLLTMVDLEELDGYDIWYAEDGDEPKYPYEFDMWQYDTDGSVSGIDGEAALSISFVDYSKK